MFFGTLGSLPLSYDGLELGFSDQLATITISYLS